MRGRKPRPTHLKLVRGNPGHRPLNLAEPKPVAGMPKPPAHLSTEARAEWKRVAPELYRLGILTRLDRAALGAYCASYGRWRQAEKALAAMDGVLTVETSHGNTINNPLIGIANRAAADTVKFAAEFGMTPSARSRVAATPPSGDDLDKYLR